MSDQAAAQTRHSSLTDTQLTGLRNLLQLLTKDELNTIMNILKRPRRLDTISKDEAINIILENTGSAIVILGRQKVTKSVILKYLTINKIQLQQRNYLSKLEVSNKCLEFWNIKPHFQVLDEVNRNLVKAFFSALDTPQNSDLDVHQNRNQCYEAMRSHIWDKCQLLLVLPNYDTKVVPEEFTRSGLEEVMFFLFSLKNEKKITFSHDDTKSLLKEQDPHGWIKINIPGMCYREGNPGTFDLILTCYEREIKDIKLTIDGFNNNTEVPSRNIIRMDSIESCQATHTDEVTPRDQEISE